MFKKDQKFSIKMLTCFMSIFLIFVSDAYALEEGCSGEFDIIQKNQSAAEVVISDAKGKELIKRPDSVKALGCFDQSMAASAKAGAIFSDTQPTFTPPWNAAIATGLGAAIGGPFGNGTTTTLAEQIGNVVDPVLGNLLGNFSGALSAVFGSTLTSAFGSIIGPVLSIPGLGGLLGSLLGINMNCDISQQLWDTQVIRQGTDPGVQFSDFREILTGAPAGWGTVATTVLGANAPILNQAEQDIQDLQTPGFYPWMPIVPTIPPNASVAAVISNF